MANKCFPSLNKTIVNSSDYTDSIRKREKWKGLKKSVENKKYMNSGYGLGINQQNKGAVLTAKSHEDLLDISKGKYFANSSLVGTSSLKNDIWAGSKLYVETLTNDNFNEYTEMLFNDQPDYWKGSNSLPLHGFSYPCRVELSYQAPDKNHELPQKTRRTPVDAYTNCFYVTYIQQKVDDYPNWVQKSVKTCSLSIEPCDNGENDDSDSSLRNTTSMGCYDDVDVILDSWKNGRYSIK